MEPLRGFEPPRTDYKTVMLAIDITAALVRLRFIRQVSLRNLPYILSPSRIGLRTARPLGPLSPPSSRSRLASNPMTVLGQLTLLP